jgi:hypothetical protein
MVFKKDLVIIDSVKSLNVITWFSEGARSLVVRVSVL